MRLVSLYLVLGLLCTAYPAVSDTQIVIDVTAHVVGNKQVRVDGKEKTVPVDTTEASVVTVRLGKDYIAVRDGKTESIYDYKKRRIFNVSRDSKIYSDSSLYSFIGFNQAEFANRLFLGNVLGKAKISNDSMEPVFVEHRFSLLHKDPSSKLEETSDTESMRYAFRGTELFYYTRKGQRLSPEQTQRYVKFIRYRFGGHPYILARIEKDANLPKTMRITHHDVSKTTYTLSLRSVEDKPDGNYSLDGLKLGPLSGDNDAFSHWLWQIKHASQKRPDPKTLLKDADADLAQGRKLDAMLAYFEYTLQAGLQVDWLSKHRDAFRGDADVQRFTSALNPKSKEQAIEAVKTLRELQPRSEGRKHLLQIFEANIHVGLHNTSEALKLFHSALTARPYIAGAYKDLGDVYYRMYQTGMAWRCWDFGREIAPGHPLFTRVSEFEQKLAREHPEFF